MTADRTGRMLVVSVLAVLAGGLTVGGLSTLVMSVKVPAVWAPIPLPVVIAEMAYPGAVGWVFATMFWVVGVRLFLGHAVIPGYSLVLFGGVVLADAVWLAISAGHGVRFQGAWHTSAVSIGNGIVASGLAYLAWSGRKRPIFWKSLAFHWGLFAWLSWYAFPYLGELP